MSALAWIKSSNTLAKNLCIMIYMWSAISFMYYLINFQLKYMPGDIYSNSFATAVAEILGITAGGVLTKIFGIRNGFIASYLTSLIGGLAIILFGNNVPSMMPIFVGIARMGVSSGFNLLYIVNTELFPTLFAATAMGICNFLARIVTIMSP